MIWRSGLGSGLGSLISKFHQFLTVICSPYNSCGDYHFTFFIMPPTYKKLEGHIASRVFVHPSVHSSRFLMHNITLEPCMLLF